MSMLDAQRAATAGFIAMDPTPIVLVPTTETVTPGGGRARVDGDPRAEQTFKVIPMTFDQRPTVTTAGGVERIIDYTLLGPWDAEAAVWDRWDRGDGSYLLVVAITDGHGYETKLLCERHLFKDGAS
jgi:hypothetical protein